MGGNNSNLLGLATGQFFPGGGKGGTPPPTPDYNAAASAQGTANQSTAQSQAILGNPNVNTPYGSQTVNFGPRTFDQSGYDAQNKQLASVGLPGVDPNAFWQPGQATVTQKLSDAGQQLFDVGQKTQLGLGNLANQGIGQVQSSLGQPFNPNLPNQVSSLSQGNFQGGPAPTTNGATSMQQYTSGANVAPSPETGAASSSLGNGSGISTGFADVGNNQRNLNFGGAPSMPQSSFTGQNDPVTQAIIQRNQPFMDTQKAQLNTQLTNQGLAPGGEAYDNAMRDFGRQQNDFNLAAIQAGAQQQNQMFGQQMAARQQGVGEVGQQGQFANTAQSQAFQQAAMRGDFGNAAQQQAFGQNVTAEQQQLARQQQAYGQQLSSTGLNLGAQQQAYGQQLGNAQFGLGQQGQAYGQQAQTAQMGNQAQQANLSQQQSAAQFQNQARQQSLQEQAYLRDQPLNQVSALMSGSQLQAPQFQPYTGAPVGQTPIFQGAMAQGQYNQGLYNAQMAQQNAMTGGLFNLGGALGSAAVLAPALAGSDRRLKSNIVRVGTHPRGFGIYEYDIFGNRERGAMADEVEKVMPEAVITTPSGYKGVYYGML